MLTILKTILNMVCAGGLTWLSDFAITKLLDLIGVGGWYRIWLMEHAGIAIAMLVVLFAMWFTLLNKTK